MQEQQGTPKTIGRYTVRRRIGGGGMGDVFKVWDPITTREIALKVLKFTYPRALHYFKREFRAIASLSHPNLVTLYDLHFEDSQYFYTMELIGGTDLYFYINGHNRIITDPKVLCAPARLERLRKSTIQLLRGLAFLHENNRVHRDIKPSNILVNQDERLKLVDFGIVRELIPGGEGESLSQVFGTSTYFSPEQSLGSHVGPSSDLYSLGVVLYELLVGTPPFEGESAQVAQMHRDREPTSVLQQVPNAPPDLAAVCTALLSKDTEVRPTARRALRMLREDADLPAPKSEFIGRTDERRRLHDAFQAAQGGANRLVVIEGKSGLGKTALVECFAHEARLFGASLFMGMCVQRDHVPYRGIDTLIERLAEAYRRQTARILRRMPRDLRGVLIKCFSFLGELLPTEEHGDPYSGADPSTGVSQLLRELGRKRSLLLVLEQIHLADDSVFDLLEKTLTGENLAPVLLVLTVRPEAVPPQSRVANFLDFLRALPQAEWIQIQPFSLLETREFVQENIDPPPTWIAEHVQVESNGVPLFVSEIVDTIRRDAPLVCPTLTESVHYRLNRLDRSAKSVLAAISLSPESTPLSILATACSLSSEGVYTCMQALSNVRFAELANSGDGRVIAVPCHSTLLTAIRESQSMSAKVQWHERLAEAHQVHRSKAYLIRHHWTAANKPSAFRTYLESEQARAMSDGDHHRVADILNLLLELPMAPEQHCLHLVQLSESQTRIGRFLDSAESLRRLEAIDADEGGRWRSRRCQLYLMAGDFEAFSSHSERLPRRAQVPMAELMVPYDPLQAERYLGETNDPWSDMVRAQIYANRVDERSLQKARQILENTYVPEIENENGWRSVVALTHAMTQRAVGELKELPDQLLTALNENRANAGPEAVLHWRLRLERVRIVLDMGNLNAARTLVRNCVLDARVRNLPGILAEACHLAAWLHLTAGELHAARPLLDEARRRWPIEQGGLPSVRMHLLDAYEAFASGEFDRGIDILQMLDESDATGLLALRVPSLERAILYGRFAIAKVLQCEELEDDKALVSLIKTARHALSRARPRPMWWTQCLNASIELHHGQLGQCIEHLTQLLERGRPSSLLPEACAWLLVGVCLKGKEKGAQARAKGKQLLERNGIAELPELTHLLKQGR